jgi:hypothetical protein
MESTQHTQRNLKFSKSQKVYTVFTLSLCFPHPCHHPQYQKEEKIHVTSYTLLKKKGRNFIKYFNLHIHETSKTHKVYWQKEATLQSLPVP